MSHKLTRSDLNHKTSQVELELLETLLLPEDATYPWNPADPESEAFFVEQEEQFLMNDLLDEELAEQSQAFYTQLDTLWSNTAPSQYSYNNTKNEAVLRNLKETLRASFAARVPQGWLDEIAQKSAEIFQRQQSMAVQLVECVQAVLPHWGEEDLLVLARPYAYAMRSSEPENVESALGNVRNRDWTALSEVEQARASLAIAQYALAQLQTSHSQE